MLGANVWRRVLGVDRATVIEEIDLDEESETVVVHVRPRLATKRRHGRCGVRAPGYDQGESRRNWRRSISGPCSASSRPTRRG